MKTGFFKYVVSESTDLFILGQGDNFYMVGKTEGNLNLALAFFPCNFSACDSPDFNLFLLLSSLFLKCQFHLDGSTFISRFLKTSW